MNKFQKRYGLKENKSTIDYHRGRRMFCIYNDELKIASPNMPYSHAVWIEQEGWITEEDDSLITQGVRGYVDKNGDIFFYTDYDLKNK